MTAKSQTFTPAQPTRETFDQWFDDHFLDPDGGSAHLPDWLKDDLKLAWDAALADQPLAAPVETATSSDDGVEVRHAEAGNMLGSVPGEEMSSSAPRLARTTVQGAASQPCAGVTSGSSDPQCSADNVELAGIWAGRAQHHEMVAREMEAYGDDSDDAELAVHLEVAATLRQCIQELLHPQPPHNEVEEPVF